MESVCRSPRLGSVSGESIGGSGILKPQASVYRKEGSVMQKTMFFSVLGSIVACGAVAQIGAPPTCCSYLYTWPAGSQGSQGACSGREAEVCESSSFMSNGNDPLAMIRGNTVREANCYRYYLDITQDFLRGDCEVPPEEGALRIGELPDGTCCWIIGGGPYIKTTTSQDYFVMQCENDCPDVVQ